MTEERHRADVKSLKLVFPPSPAGFGLSQQVCFLPPRKTLICCPDNWLFGPVHLDSTLGLSGDPRRRPGTLAVAACWHGDDRFLAVFCALLFSLSGHRLLPWKPLIYTHSALLVKNYIPTCVDHLFYHAFNIHLLLLVPYGRKKKKGKNLFPQLLRTSRYSTHRRCSAPLLSTSPSSKPKHKHSHHLSLLSWQQCSGGAPHWWTCVWSMLLTVSALSPLIFSVYVWTLTDKGHDQDAWQQQGGRHRSHLYFMYTAPFTIKKKNF